MKSNGDNSVLICAGIFWPEIGGPASYAKTLASKLASSQPVTVLTYSSVRRSNDADLPFAVVRVWSGWPKGLRHLIYFLQAFRLTRRHQIVFSMNAVSAGLPARFASRMFKRKFAVKIVGDAAWERAINNGTTSLLINDFQKSKRPGGLIGLLHWTQFQVCKGAHHIIVPSKYLSGIVAGWGIPAEKITVIYNGTDFVPSTLSKEEARKKLGISGNIILSIGRLVPWKGFRMLIKIMPKLGEINQFFSLIIVGSGPDRRNLELMIRNLGLDRKVRLAGKASHSELADYLAAADLFVLNTGYEGFSHQILEVMAAGVPLITTNAGGNVEIIRQGENGLMVKYNDEFNLIEAIRVLWNNPDIQERLVEEAEKTVKEFAPERMFNETISLLEHV